MPQFNTDLDCEFLGELSATVYFDYTEGQKEIIHAPAEDCQEGLAPEVSLLAVIVVINQGHHDIQHMIPEVYVDQLEERAIEFINEQGE
jgi:hypothetical protein